MSLGMVRVQIHCSTANNQSWRGVTRTIRRESVGRGLKPRPSISTREATSQTFRTDAGHAVAVSETCSEAFPGAAARAESRYRPQSVRSRIESMRHRVEIVGEQVAVAVQSEDCRLVAH